ncbi:MAG: DNA-directed RNA polymerase subunit beta' [Candidatus Buchananbacteria bacterium]|nr:DNA-directed RNA polymerase subunit beta' [Candidatus Buchananbacteria bacterium]
MPIYEEKKVIDFDSLRLTLASPDDIHQWSHGEVLKPETINYRTQRPEKDGLFCEKIFGPSKDWECYCGKYKKVRYKGIVCDKCGVEVTRSVVRRERMGHINLAAPVSHIWFLRGVPSKIGLILDLSPVALEKVIYFANFIITKVDDDLKLETIEQIRQEFKAKKKKIENDFAQQLNVVKVKISQDKTAVDQKDKDSLIEQEALKHEDAKKEKIKELEQALQLAEQELKELKPLKIISEHVYQDLSLKYGHIFSAGIGAEAVHDLLKEVNLEKLIAELEQDSAKAHGPQKEKLAKRLRLVRNFIKTGLRPEWMVLNTIPVIPPDLRPMVPLDGGRFATSDLNDLYRRIINRNNRLKQLIELNAPEVITRNEKRMLQEAADALIDNSARHGKTVVASTGQKRMLKSLADILKGKQGRFRQNLLGKRIDYSGRSVIVVGPKLKMHQCGLPKRMALELFRPFIISRLIRDEYVHNVRSANRFISLGKPEVWDILEEIIKDAFVMLNRAPTLHRLGIQAFRPILIEGKAIQVHPLVCEAYNADFDGDQMAVHVPLTKEARWEAEHLMLSTNNLLKPATGDPVAKPTKDLVWGCYYMTMLNEDNAPKAFSSFNELLLAYKLGHVKMQEKVKIKVHGWLEERFLAAGISDRIVETSVGRILFNEILPAGYPYINKTTNSKALRQIISECLLKYDNQLVANLLDEIKTTTLKYLTRSGYSWGMDDIPDIPGRAELIKQGEEEVSKVEGQYDSGLLTDSERHTRIIKIWMGIKDKVVDLSRHTLDLTGPIYTMVESGARGSWSQLIQIVGMKGLVTNPSGEIIELPVKGNFKKGFDVLEFFISTHGARKGLSDTALRTANAGYLTRRLVDVSQDMVVSEEDCGDENGVLITKSSCEKVGVDIVERIKGRFVLEKIVDPKTKKTIVKAGELITPEKSKELQGIEIPEIKVRSVMNCKSLVGCCQKCYGWDLAHSRVVDIGTAVGIMAAQSIGEPGTQLTMRTFHTGGVAGLDITQGLPRVEEIFECRPPKMKAFMAEVAGKVKIEKANSSSCYNILSIEHEEIAQDIYPLPKDAKKAKLLVKDSAKVKKGEALFTDENSEKVLAKSAGTVKVEADRVIVVTKENKLESYRVPTEFNMLCKDGELVGAGDILTDGSLDLKQLFKLRGKEATQRYIVDEIQKIYGSQGQKLNDRHVEMIASQMFSRVMIKDPGDTELLVGERLDQKSIARINSEAKEKNKRPAEFEDLLLGITKVSLSTSSFLAAASFQETARVLINAAVEGRIDRLEGLKENVIIGRLIPAGTGYHKKD